MSVTSDQRADLGTRYVDEIKRRIKVRTDAKVKVRQLPGAQNTELLETAQKELHSMLGGTKHSLIVRKVSTDAHNKRISLIFGSDNEYSTLSLCNIPAATLPKTWALVAYSADETKGINMNRDLCQELEFLANVSGGSAIGGFQSYVARLWSPAKKTDRLSDADFRTHIEAFLNTKRGFTCKL